MAAVVDALIGKLAMAGMALIHFMVTIGTTHQRTSLGFLPDSTLRLKVEKQGEVEGGMVGPRRAVVLTSITLAARIDQQGEAEGGAAGPLRAVVVIMILTRTLPSRQLNRSGLATLVTDLGNISSKLVWPCPLHFLIRVYLLITLFMSTVVFMAVVGQYVLLSAGDHCCV